VLILIICGTHILIFWQDNPKRLSLKAKQTIEEYLPDNILACSDISLWEVAMLMKTGKLRNDICTEQYINDICLTMSLSILPITPKIAALSQQDIFVHKDPADRLIASTATAHIVPLISADSKLHDIKALDIIW